jgi:uncharacterized protein (TIGR00730 family)
VAARGSWKRPIAARGRRGGRSVGCNIALPREQSPNAYLDRSVTCRYFFVRKVLLFRYSYALIGLPGGLGTLDELFEALTLIQTRKIANFPVVLFGTRYWQPVEDLLRHLALERAIDERDLELVLVTDSVSEALEHIQRHAIEPFALRRKVLRPSTLLGERHVPSGTDAARRGRGWLHTTRRRRRDQEHRAMKLTIRLGLAVLLVAITAGPGSQAQTARMKQVMRTKLEHSQRILEAVVTSNWQSLDRESWAMAMVVRDPVWSVLATPEYVRHSEAFLRATDDLMAAAKSRDLERPSLGFISLTTSCVGCHRYLARARIALGSPDMARFGGPTE